MTGTTPEIHLLEPDTILTHEATRPERVAEVAAATIAAGALDYPVIVGRVHATEGPRFVLLDGHHRLEALTGRLAVRLIPSRVIDYADDTLVTVEAWRRGERVTKGDVIAAALSRELMPIKTSRHRFLFETSPCNQPLGGLVAPAGTEAGA